MTDLRTLAQAVVDAVAVYEADHRASAPWSPVRDALEDLGMFLGGGVGVTHARAILAALDAERAQGYARAMGEVVERCEQEADYTGRSDYAAGHKDAHERLAVWAARERLPAAAERD